MNPATAHSAPHFIAAAEQRGMDEPGRYASDKPQAPHPNKRGQLGSHRLCVLALSAALSTAVAAERLVVAGQYCRVRVVGDACSRVSRYELVDAPRVVTILVGLT